MCACWAKPTSCRTARTCQQVWGCTHTRMHGYGPNNKEKFSLHEENRLGNIRVRCMWQCAACAHGIGVGVTARNNQEMCADMHTSEPYVTFAGVYVARGNVPRIRRTQQHTATQQYNGKDYYHFWCNTIESTQHDNSSRTKGFGACASQVPFGVTPDGVRNAKAPPPDVCSEHQYETGGS